MDRLTIARLEKAIETGEYPCPVASVFHQLLDTMRENERLREACIAVDALWSGDAKEVKAAYNFEMETMSPVGGVWKRIREALSSKESSPKKEWDYVDQCLKPTQNPEEK